MASSAPTAPSAVRESPPARPNMVSLEQFLSGPAPPPHPPLPWARIILTSLALILSLAVLGYVAVQGEQSARTIWLQVGRNLDRHDKPTDTPGGRSFGKTGAPSYGTLVIRNSLVEALEQSL